MFCAVIAHLWKTGLWPVFSEALNFSVAANLQRRKTVGRHIIIYKGFGYFSREMDDPLAESTYLIHHHIPAEKSEFSHLTDEGM